MSIVYKFIGVILLLFLSVSCTTNRLNELEYSINDILISGNNQSPFILTLDTISSFEWDELLVAGPYVALSEIEGYHFEKFPSTATDYDQFVFFGFISKKKGIKWLSPTRNEYIDSLYKGSFGYKIYPRTETNFKIQNNSHTSRL